MRTLGHHRLLQHARQHPGASLDEADVCADVEQHGRAVEADVERRAFGVAQRERALEATLREEPRRVGGRRLALAVHRAATDHGTLRAVGDAHTERVLRQRVRDRVEDLPDHRVDAVLDGHRGHRHEQSVGPGDGVLVTAKQALNARAQAAIGRRHVRHRQGRLREHGALGTLGGVAQGFLSSSLLARSRSRIFACPTYAFVS
jgi:hypothetical protein